MKFLIVLALFGAACAYDEIQPVVLGEPEIPAIEMVDYGQLYIPNIVLRELGIEVLPYDEHPQPVHFVNENGDIQSFVDFAPVENPLEETEPAKFVDDVQSLMYNEAPVEESYAPPAEIDAVKIADVVSFVNNVIDVVAPVEIDAIKVEAPVEESNVAPVEIEAVKIADAIIPSDVEVGAVEAPLEESNAAPVEIDAVNVAAPVEVEPVQIVDAIIPSEIAAVEAPVEENNAAPVEIDAVNVAAPVEIEPVQIADAIIPSEIAAVEAPVEENNAAPVEIDAVKIDDLNVVSFVDNVAVNAAAPVEIEAVQIAEPVMPSFEAPVKEIDGSPIVIDAVKIVDAAPESSQDEANIRDMLRKYRGKVFANPLWR